MTALWPDFDNGLLKFINHLGTFQWDIFWGYTTNIVAWIPLYLFFIYLVVKNFSRQKTLAIITTLLFTLVFTLLFTEMIKELVQRSRPLNDPGLQEELRVVIRAYGYSFFSGHASNSMAVTTLFVLFLRKKQKWVYILYLWPLFFGASRLYFAVHYPTDVFVGWLAGFLIALVFYRYLGHTLLDYAAYREAVPDRK
ncbi:phosphatase PAP2 family protein [Sinomicrobium weinanense]|uniref:Phosphatase PAP2 family protein n=1 Tax=Sinomicrobium weinanense TaxID=2842200 RepID=A0A926JRK8_9FLAO|nr:phosphatase PAP2 family protein [Sinomicrobium weinanense]MBC9795951.1 phosphatase PAP2 family protein [Sinomicrobium weinanense]MBU3122070.1 phosphatase PAP2 family protein [Sinomicrobium weinanense]